MKESQRLKIEYVETNKLILNSEKNPRKSIKDQKLKELMQSIKSNPEYFEARPILINQDNEIFAGHKRYEAAMGLEMKKVPVIRMNVTKEKQQELMLKDNLHSAEWDFDLLSNFGEDLLKQIGFEDIDLKEIFLKFENKEKEIDVLKTENKCPKCGYSW